MAAQMLIIAGYIFRISRPISKLYSCIIVAKSSSSLTRPDVGRPGLRQGALERIIFAAGSAAV